MLAQSAIIVALVLGARSGRNREQPQEDLEPPQAPTARTWYLEKTPIADEPLATMATAPSDPQTLYVATQSGKIFVTQDGGITWQGYDLADGDLSMSGSPRQSASKSGSGVSASPPEAGFAAESIEGPPNTVDAGDLPAEVLVGDMAGPWTRYGYGTEGIGFPLMLPTVDFFGVIHSSGPPLDRGGVSRPLHFGNTSASIKQLCVHPSRPAEVYAATNADLFFSNVGGRSWQRQQVNGEADTTFVVYHPWDPRRRYVKTQSNLFLSRDGGITFKELTGLTGSVNSLELVLSDPDVAYAATSAGVFRSINAGETFSRVRDKEAWQVIPDPNDAARLLVIDPSGLHKSSDAGQSFDKIGKVLESAPSHLAIAPNDSDHLVANVGNTLWESRDFGATWTVLYALPNAPSAVIWETGGSGAILVLSDDALLRLTPHKPKEPSSHDLDSYRARTRDDPTLAKTLAAARKYYGLEPESYVDMSDRITASKLLPDFAGLAFGYLGANGTANLPDGFCRVGACIRRPGAPFELSEKDQNPLGRYADYRAYWGMLVLNWDLPGAMYSKADSGLFSSWQAADEEIARNLRHVCEQRQRALWRLLAENPADMETRSRLQLRVEELTARLAGHTGQLWHDALKWIENYR